ncbi:RNA polymerase Rpb7 [Gaertneriomyces semiglobifer]|nr:RNA polymerase Rpb7 [Gaertneriomyces semiglobifer]
MFFVKTLSHTIRLPPQFFGPWIQDSVQRKLYEEVEGQIDGRYGYIIAVLDVKEVGRGVLQPLTGLAEFEVVYEALVMKLFKNMVVDGVVSTVNQIGFWLDIGPLQMFVSANLIPQYYRFDPNANPPAYVPDTDDAETLRIEKGVGVRARIIGVRNDAREIFCVGTIKEDYLGPQEDV